MKKLVDGVNFGALAITSFVGGCYILGYIVEFFTKNVPVAVKLLILPVIFGAVLLHYAKEN